MLANISNHSSTRQHQPSFIEHYNQHQPNKRPFSQHWPVLISFDSALNTVIWNTQKYSLYSVIEFWWRRPRKESPLKKIGHSAPNAVQIYCDKVNKIWALDPMTETGQNNHLLHNRSTAETLRKLYAKRRHSTAMIFKTNVNETPHTGKKQRSSQRHKNPQEIGLNERDTTIAMISSSILTIYNA